MSRAAETGGEKDWIQVASSIGGVIGPIAFLASWALAALLTPGYSPVSQYLSELGASPGAAIWNTGLALLGLLVIGFALGLHRGLTKGSIIGPLLLVLAGAGAVGAAAFPCDPGCPVAGTSTNSLHFLFSELAFAPISFAPLAFSRRLKKDDRWRDLGPYCLATGILALILFFVLLPLAVFGSLAPWRGVIEGLFVAATWIVWIEVMAIRLLHLSLPSQASEA